jgi:cytochrome b561
MRRRMTDLVELVTLGALIAWIVTPLFSSLAAGLTDSLESSLGIPYLRGVATGFLFAAAGVILALARLRRRAPRESTDPAKSSSDVTSLLAYAGLGLLFGGVLSGEWTTTFGSLAGERLAVAYPRAAIVIGIALVIATMVLLSRRSARRGADAASGVAGDPWVGRVESIFNTAASIVGIAFALGIALLFTRFIVDSWVRTYPWSLIALALFAAYLLWEAVRDRRKNSKSMAATIKEFGQGFGIVLLICAVVTIVLDTNYRGFTESSVVFDKMAPATRLAFFAMPGAFLGVLVIGLARFAYSGHHVRVFISFHHSREESAEELARALGEKGFIVGRIPFRTDYEHDNLLQRIQNEIRSCAAMVCLPGAQPSFIENEVLVASTLRKFILFVVGDKDPRLPNTAYYGYPVFRLEPLSRQDFDPIAQLILLVAGNWKASLRHFLDGWTQHLQNGKLLLWLVIVFVTGTYVVGAAYAFTTAGVAEVVSFVSTFHRAYIELLGGWMLLWIWLNAFLVGSVFALIGQIRARRVLRQDILTGHLTREVLRQRIGGGKRALRLLACICEKPPAAEHEGESGAAGPPSSARV